MALIKDNDGDIINVNKYTINMIKRIEKYVDKDNNGNNTYYYFYLHFTDGEKSKIQFYIKNYSNDDIKCKNDIEKLYNIIVDLLLKDSNQDKLLEPCNTINLKK